MRFYPSIGEGGTGTDEVSLLDADLAAGKQSYPAPFAEGVNHAEQKACEQHASNESNQGFHIQYCIEGQIVFTDRVYHGDQSLESHASRRMEKRSGIRAWMF